MKLTKITLLAIALSAAFYAGCKIGGSSPWIWNIEGKKTTLKDLEDAYNGYFFLMAQQFQASPDQLKEYLKNPERAGDPRMVQMLMNLQGELKKENFADRYKQLLLLNYEAQKTGFLKDDKLVSKLEFLKQYFVANMFLMDKLNLEKVQVEEKEAVEECERLRAGNPRAKRLPIDQCVEYARQQIKVTRAQQQQGEFMKNVMESYKIAKNPNFNLKEYLSKEDASGEKKMEGDKKDEKTEEKKTEGSK